MNYIKHKKGGVCTHAFFILPLRGYFAMFKYQSLGIKS